MQINYRKERLDDHSDRRAMVRRVTYELTGLGRGLLEPLRTICSWAEEHWDELLDARES